MSGKGISLAENCHIVNITPPIDINGAGATSDYFNVKGASHVSIICQLGVTGAATTITVEESDDASGSNTTAIAFTSYAEETAGGDTLTGPTATTSSGITGSTNDGVMYVIEIDASQLTDGFPYLVVKASDPSAATLYSAVAILSGVRYQQNVTPTAIT